MVAGSSSQQQTLTSPPFFTINSVDPASPISTQLEQIEQLNTLALQEIDANFARFHQVITTRILPAIKRYAIATQPVYEAARFWQDFYEVAYGMAAGDRDVTEDQTRDTIPYEDHTMTLRRESFDDSASFFINAAQGASSTPLPARYRSPQTSLEESIGSPFDRTEKQLKKLALNESGDEPTPSVPSGYSYQLSEPSPLLERQSAFANVNDSLDGAPTPRPAQAEVKQARRNFLDETASSFDARSYAPIAPRSIASTRIARNPPAALEDDHYPYSPPVTMAFALPPRASAVMAAGSTPIKAPFPPSNENDINDLLQDYEPSPRAPTPQELRRYSLMPSDLGRGRLLFDDSFEVAGPSSVPSNVAGGQDELNDTIVADSQRPRRSLANTSYGSDIQIATDGPGRVINDEDSDEDGESDSDEDDTAARPYRARYDAEQGFEFVNDSMNSDASDYQGRRNVTDTGAVPAVGRHETSELFGPMRSSEGLPLRGSFALHQQDEMLTLHGGRLEDADVPYSPTNPRQDAVGG